jgi:transglutaminase superfamily protein
MLAAEARAIAVLLRVALRLLPLSRVVTMLARIPRSRDRVATVADCARAAADATRSVAHPTCLFTSLTAFALLARRGHAPQLAIGAARHGGFDAHAWVTVAGVPVIPNAREYSTLWTYDETARAR